MAKSRRKFRVAERVQSVVATEILRMSDPRFFLVTISSVVMSRDLKYAKVYWMVSGGPERVKSVQEAFDSASGFLRTKIAKDIGMRGAPELRFYYDDTLDTQAEINDMFTRLNISAEVAEEEEREG